VDRFLLRLCFLFLIEAMFDLLLAAEFCLFKGYVVLFCQLSFWVGLSHLSCNNAESGSDSARSDAKVLWYICYEEAEIVVRSGRRMQGKDERVRISM
jgi:hypothetical protein